MSQSIYPVPAHIKDATRVDKNKYNTLYKQSIDDPEGFWGSQGPEGSCLPAGQS